jgi:hypothetical protein
VREPQLTLKLALLHIVQRFFLFFPRLRERRLVLNKKSIVLSNNAFIRVGNEGLDILSSRRAMDKSIASLRSALSFFIYPSLA